MEPIMAKTPLASSSFKEISSDPPAAPAVTAQPAVPDAASARTGRGRFTREFRLAAVRYAASCGKPQRAAARDMGVSDKTLAGWVADARPEQAGVVDVARFDELTMLRAQNRDLLAANQRLAAERDFLKKCAGYFANPANGGSK